jgi:hypothetical protein
MAALSARAEIVSMLIPACHPSSPVRTGRLGTSGIPAECALSLRTHGRRAALDYRAKHGGNTVDYSNIGRLNKGTKCKR